MISYRHGTPTDIPVLVQFWHDMLVESKVAGSGFVADWRARLEAHFRQEIAAATTAWFLAEEDGHVVGTAAAILSSGTSGVLLDVTATLAGVYVVPAHRRRGIARVLTLRAVDWCRQRGCVYVRLQASEAGRALYEALGFKTFREMMKLDVR